MLKMSKNVLIENSNAFIHVYIVYPTCEIYLNTAFHVRYLKKKENKKLLNSVDWLIRSVVSGILKSPQKVWNVL